MNLLCLLLLSGATSSADAPRVVHIGPVAANVLAIEVQAGEMRPIRQVPYVKQPGDRTEQQVNPKTGEPRWVRLIRGGRAVGYLVGRERRVLSLFETLAGDPLDVAAADRPESYRIAGAAGTQSPVRVWRKTKTNDWADSGPGFTSRHYIYLQLPEPLQRGAAYTIQPRFALAPARLRYVHRPDRARSEAVHVSHIGFRPDDPVKVAFLSLWTGTGGAYDYGRDLPFTVRDVATGKAVFSGRTGPAWETGRPEQYGRKVNHALTGVQRIDFGALRTPGRYRVCVESVGCSYPFTVGRGVWQRAFEVSMLGAYHHRSGIALGPPWTTYRRPRPFHPADGVKVYESTCPLMYSGNGLNVMGRDSNNFDCLVDGRTDRIVPNAWGGYMDAGDWDRRIQHLEATRLHLELLDLAPDWFAQAKLRTPESANRLPDVLDEALFNLDHYRRLQTPEGGIRGGVESSEHPVSAETSWQESQTVLTYSPGIWETWIYAGVAARAAGALGRFDGPASRRYRDSAVRAMLWAEAEYERWKTGADYRGARPDAKREIESERRLAAAELFRLTGEARWHELFAASPAPLSEDAAFVYARTDPARTRAALREQALATVTRAADQGIEFAAGNAFGIALAGRRPHPYSGFYSIPAPTALVRAHALTGRAAYLEAIVRSAQFSAGANPMNITMTTGLGHDFPRHPLHEDSRHSGQPAPAGITVYGPMDLVEHDDWPEKRLNEQCTPPATAWPVAESYFDIYVWPAVNEYTVMQTIGPTAYVWGYLAAR